MSDDEQDVTSLYKHDVQRWCMALCQELVPADNRLSMLFQNTPTDLNRLNWSDATVAWVAAEDAAENDYLDLALTELTEHGMPEVGKITRHSALRDLLWARRHAERKLDYVMVADYHGTDVLCAVLTWMCSRYPDLEVDARLRAAARKLAQRAEFRNRFTWTGHSRHRPKHLPRPDSTCHGKDAR